MLNAPRVTPARYMLLPFMIWAPLKIPLKSFIPNIMAIMDEPAETTPRSNIKNKKNTNLLNATPGSISPIRLGPIGFPGTKRKKAMPEIKATIPITSDSKEVLLYLLSSIKSAMNYIRRDVTVTYKPKIGLGLISGT